MLPLFREWAAFVGNKSKELGAIRSINLASEAVDERRDFREEAEGVMVKGTIMDAGRFRGALTIVRIPLLAAALGEAGGAEQTENGLRCARFTMARNPEVKKSE